ncbi:hypothetical protein LguiB_002231 [Lonicera macranthoides]
MMLLKNELEDKQLNLNQPILSVRRFLSTLPAKEDQKRKTDKSILNIPHIPSYKSESRLGPVSNPGTIPFIWEQSPGRPKCENTTENCVVELHEAAPKLPPGRISKAKMHDSDKVNKNVTKFESLEDTVKEDSNLVDGNEAYSDTVDSLSQTELFSLNFSVTGVSGMDSRDLKRSEISLTDPLTRDLMMGRFLPAAKTMASETPKYAPRKQSGEVKKTANDNKKSPLRYRPHIVPYFAGGSEKRESDDEYDERQKSLKVCGLLPRFCPANPVPGMSMRTRLPVSPVQSTQHSIHDGRLLGGLNTTESCCIRRGAENGSGSPIVEKTLYIDTVHKVESPKLKSFSPDSKRKPNLTKNDFRILTRSKNYHPNDQKDSCIDIDSPNIVEDVPKRRPNDQDVLLSTRNQVLGVEEEDFTFPEIRENSYISRLEVPVPPPLPKSPTDSWLRRTLPSTSFKNLSVWSKTSSGDLSPTDSWLRPTLPSTSSKNLSVWSKTSSGDLVLKTNAKTT